MEPPGIVCAGRKIMKSRESPRVVRPLRLLTVIIAVGLAAGLSIGCDVIQIGTAGIRIKMASQPLARDILPNIPLDVESYDITGTGPSGSSLTVTDFTGTTYLNTTLVPGVWTFTAEGKNENGTIIVTSPETEVTLEAGQTASVSLLCVPMAGTGTFTLTLEWPAGLVADPEIEAFLRPDEGNDIPLAMEPDGESATVTNSTLANGYYVLTIKLKDNGNGDFLNWSWNEPVLIYSGRTSPKTYTLVESDVDLPDDRGVSLSLSSDTKKPLIVTLNHFKTSTTVGERMLVVANADKEPDSWQWYLDGDPLDGQTGQRLDFATDLAQNSVHSVVVIARKGDIAGSAGGRFSVRPGQPVTLAQVPDALLRAAFETATSKAFANITTADLVGIEEIDLSEQATFTDLTGIELCKNLWNLRIPKTGVTDISMVDELRFLSSLNLKRCAVTDFSPIASLRLLGNLRITPVTLADISWMTPANLPNLKFFSIGNQRALPFSQDLLDRIAAFDLLEGFEFQFTLNDTQFNQLYDTVLAPVADTLISFQLWSGGTATQASLAKLANLTNLKSLAIAYFSNLSVLTPFTVLTDLVQFYCDGTNVSDLAPLETLYDAGAFRDWDWMPAEIGVEDLDLNLTPGTDNRNVVDYLIVGGVDVLYEFGNTTVAP